MLKYLLCNVKLSPCCLFHHLVYSSFWIQEVEPCTSISSIVVDKEHHCHGKCYVNRLWERLHGLSRVTLNWLVLLRPAKDWRSLAWLRWVQWDSTGTNSGPRIMIHVWICYPTVLWVLYEGMYHVWQGRMTPQSIISPPTTPKTCSAVTLVIGTKSMDIIIGLVVQGWWHGYGYAVPLFYECYMRYGPHLTAWITPQTMTWPQTTPQTCSAVTLVFGTKSLNHGPHQWCGGPRMMTQVWICYPTVL